MVHWFMNTPSVGSGITIVVATSVFFAYFKMLRWIQTAPPDPESGEETPPPDGKA